MSFYPNISDNRSYCEKEIAENRILKLLSIKKLCLFEFRTGIFPQNRLEKLKIDSIQQCIIL